MATLSPCRDNLSSPDKAAADSEALFPHATARLRCEEKGREGEEWVEEKEGGIYGGGCM
jgi:hypothetical protein